MQWQFGEVTTIHNKEFLESYQKKGKSFAQNWTGKCFASTFQSLLKDFFRFYQFVEIINIYQFPLTSSFRLRVF